MVKQNPFTYEKEISEEPQQIPLYIEHPLPPPPKKEEKEDESSIIIIQL